MFQQIREKVLRAFPGLERSTIRPLGHGLIHQTFELATQDSRFVLQRMAPIFAPDVNHNIAAVTRALAAAGLATSQLVPTRDGRLWSDLGASGVWRVQTFVRGHGFDRVQSTAQAFSASELVARFHRSLVRLDYRFVGMRSGVHDTAAHLARLRDALAAHRDHRLHPDVTRLAQSIHARAGKLESLPASPLPVGHGDLKLNNILFAGETGPDSDKAVCLIDLDTVGPTLLGHELGDAWRSWCNRSGEEATQAIVDMGVMQASFEGYAGAIGRDLTKDERRALLMGPEWISLELSSRFAGDALNESYFGWNPVLYRARGEHNLARALGQLSLHDAFVSCRVERRKLLGL